MLDAILEADVRPGHAWSERLDPRAIERACQRTAVQSLANDRERPSLSALASPTVFVIDEDDSVRAALASTIEAAGWRVETFCSGREFLDRPRLSAPSCLVLDISIGDIDSLDLQRRLAIERPAMPIIFTARHADIPVTVRAMKAGALEFFMKPLREDELQSAIVRAIECSRDARRAEAEMLALRASYASLTPREKDVLALIVVGRLNKQAADQLGISEITVKAHRGSVMRKMQARTFASLVGMATRLGLAAV